MLHIFLHVQKFLQNFALLYFEVVTVIMADSFADMAAPFRMASSPSAIRNSYEALSHPECS